MQICHAEPHPLPGDDHERLNNPLIPDFPIVSLSPYTNLQLRVVWERDRDLPCQLDAKTNASVANIP
jgi:hypothetical protein